ncbi:MAG TPA: ABC transporter ATP-binding protein [Alphaproteobacteria bacterium]
MSQRSSTFALSRRILMESRKFWPHIWLIFLVSLAATPLALLTPVPLKIVVDTVIGEQPLPSWLEWLLPSSFQHINETLMLIFAAALMVAVALLMSLQGLAAWILQTYTGESIALSFRAKLFQHMQRLSITYHDRQGTADSLYRIQHDSSAVQYIVTHSAIPFVSAIVMLIAMIATTALMAWDLALVALAVAPVLFLLSGISGRVLRERWHRIKELESSAMAVVQETLGALRVVKAFGKEEHEGSRFVHRSGQLIRNQVRMAGLEGGFDLGVALTIAVGTAAVLVLGVNRVRADSLTLGELLIIMSYLAALYAPLQTISKKVAEMQSWLASAERVFALLDARPAVEDRPNARPLGRALGAISYKNVGFAYEDAPAALTDISFDIPAGSRVGIYGATGAGKSTLVSLLFRFFDPAEGAIELDGVDLRDYKLADLRNQYGIMLQEPMLFSATIAENIGYARPTATQEEIVAAAKAANAHDFILRMPDGYDTVVGERGMMLSGGERQRVSLARAFLRNAPLLVLDEPTSSIDLVTEAGIMEAMERLMRGRTVFIIAHRLQTLKDCDMWLRIEGGRLVATGAGAPLPVHEGKTDQGLREVS